MTPRAFRALLAALLALACDREPAVDVAAPPPPGRLDFAGLYRVSGYTTVRRSGEQRRIEGTVIVARAAAGSPEPYTATFDLETEFASPAGPIRADVIGSARAAEAREGLAGTAETRIFLASVPGLDPSFAWVPGRLGPRVVSEFRMRPAAESERTFEIQIETRAARGESYEDTRTTLHATRAPGGLGPGAGAAQARP
jgi:hypothetical protein